MWKFLARTSAAVFCVCVVALVALMEWRTGRVEWRLAFAIAALATALFAVRAFSPLRAGARRRFIREELHRRRQRIRAFGGAVHELIDSMARLSPGDLSLYQAALQSTGGGDTACILTSKGSPNHDVLVQLTDLKLATPEEFKTLGAPPHAFTSVRYALTPFGRSFVPRLMPDVLRRRALLAGGTSPQFP